MDDEEEVESPEERQRRVVQNEENETKQCSTESTATIRTFI